MTRGRAKGPGEKQIGVWAGNGRNGRRTSSARTRTMKGRGGGSVTDVS